MDDLSDHMKIKNIALYYIAQIKIVLTCFKVIDLYRKKNYINENFAAMFD